MTENGGLLRRIAGRGFFAQAGLLYGATVAILLPVLPIGWILAGPEGVAAASVAAFLCFSGGLATLVWNAAFPGPKLLVVRILGGMLPRMGIPLAGGLAVQITIRPLAEGGVLIYLLVFYPVLLALETYLSLTAEGLVGRNDDNTRAKNESA